MLAEYEYNNNVRVEQSDCNSNLMKKASTSLIDSYVNQESAIMKVSYEYYNYTF